MRKVTRTERGWAGHHILAGRCRFRRNTLLTCGKVSIVVSTIGLSRNLANTGFDTVGAGDCYFETMAFHSKTKDWRYHDADVERNVCFDSPWRIYQIDADDLANDMHEAVVAELTEQLKEGHLI